MLILSVSIPALVKYREPGIPTGCSCSQYPYTGNRYKKSARTVTAQADRQKITKKQKYMITSTCYNLSFMSLIISRCSSFKAVDEFPAFIKAAERLQVKPLIIIDPVREPVYTGIVIKYSIPFVFPTFGANLLHSLFLFF